MTLLHDLFDEGGQSPWVDNLKRSYLTDGLLQGLVERGVRGVTSNPTIFQKAISDGTAYDEQFQQLARDHNVEDSYWELVIKDVVDACRVMRGVYDRGGRDGFVSIEVSPALALETAATTEAARDLANRVAQPNCMVKIPGTEAGLPSIRQMIAEGRNVNVTLIFSLERYADVIEAYIAGLEECAASRKADLSDVNSVASFFISRVDTEVDRRLTEAGADASLQGKAAVAQAKLAYELFGQKFTGPRWEALAAKGAKVQRPLWASTSTKNPAYPDLLYVDNLIGPDTVNTMPDATVEAFADHGRVARTVDSDVDTARQSLHEIEAAGVSMIDVGRTLENEGVASFQKSYDELLQVLGDKYEALRNEDR